MKRLTDLKSNNKGLSLLELVVVIAIMSVIGVTLFLATSVATDRHVNSCANKVCTAFEQTRNLTLGKQLGRIEFWVNANNEICAQIYINDKVYSDEVAIGHTGLTMTFVYMNPSSPSTITRKTLSSDGAVIEFSRSTGGISNHTFGVNTINPAVEKLYEIEISNGHKTTTISVDTYTGRINVNT